MIFGDELSFAGPHQLLEVHRSGRQNGVDRISGNTLQPFVHMDRGMACIIAADGSIQLQTPLPEQTEGIKAHWLTLWLVGHAVEPRLRRSCIRAGHVQSVHHDIAGAQSAHGRRQMGGKAIAVHVDDQRRFFWIVQTLTHAHAKKGRVSLHQAGGHLVLDGHGLRQCGIRQ
jgi:hypothetical protein